MNVRLAVVTHNVVRGDGQGRANYEIVRHALKRGFSVHLFADRVDEDLIAAGAVWKPIQPGFLRRINLIKVASFAAQADRLLRKAHGEYDVVHGYGYCLSVPHDVNTSQFVHSAWRQSPAHTARQHRNAYGAYQWTYSALNAVWERKAYHRARLVVAASSTVREELKQIGIPEKRLRVILNGADLSEFHPATRPEERERAPLKLPENVPLALFAGDIKTPRKNLDTVLKAMALPEVRASGLHLAVVGRAEGSPFPAMAEQLGIADRVHFLDFRRDIAAIMRAVDLFVFPSRYEACALVLAEATASGLPIITARTTGGAELVTPEAGIQVDHTEDVHGIAAAMAQLAGDPDRRERMRQAAWQRAQTNTWEHIAEQYLNVYNEFRK
ncbi:MAG: glycosyltransferase family 4 protein [Capsulimonadales bacterium]|nr:glycosyltransferase family 4 protein [Capsulimonadales bacterium]